MTIYYTTGYAGTGKSTKLLELLPTLPQQTTVVIGPTHKALARLAKEYDGEIELKTIHSLMGLIPRINEEAKHIGNISTIFNLDKPIEGYTDIVIDEAGMINEEHFLELVAKLEVVEEENDIEITMHLFLDPYQLLPVKGRQLMTDKATTTNLTTQYRSESPDIVNLYTQFVDYLRGVNTDNLSTPYSKNVKPLDIKHFRKGDKLLAYTNEAVGKWNKKIAKHLGITSYVGQEVQLGNQGTVIMEGFVDLNYQELLRLYESDTLVLQNKQINKKFLEQALRALLHKDIKFILAEGRVIPVIVGIGEAAKINKKAGEAAIKNRSKFSHVYALGRAFVMDYNFASTVHKSQGSEYSTVFVDKEDIQKSIFKGNYKTYARLMYVAISRCKNTLYI